MKREIKSSTALLIVFAVAVIFGGGILAYFYATQPTSYDLEEHDNYVVTRKVAVLSETINEIADWKTYINNDFGFSLKYPSDWKTINLNIIDSNITADGKYGGKVLSSSDGKNGEINFDNDNQMTMRSYSSTFKSYGPLEFNKRKVDVDWTAVEFAQYMGLETNRILLAKKLSDKSILIVDSINIECSPSLRILVVTPLNETYPNLEISISAVDESKDPDLLAYIEKTKTDKSLDVCDHTEPYTKIAEKINNGTYSDKLNLQIKTAQLITDSLQLIK